MKAKFYLFLSLSIALIQCAKDDTVTETPAPTPNYADSVKNGLWGYYTFDGNLADKSGNNHTCVGKNNIQLTYDIWGNDGALDFNGVNNYATIEDGKQFPEGDFSICFLVMPRTINGGRIFQKADASTAKGASFGIGFNIDGVTPDLVFNITKSDNNCNVFTDETNSTPLNISKDLLTYAWYYITCKFEKGIQKVYYNGVLVATQDRSNQTTKFCSTSPFNLGIWWQSDLRPFNGKLDELRIYTRGLTEDEIKYLAKKAMD